MRALQFLILLLVFAGNLHAQDKNDLTLAVDHYTQKEYEKAVYHINLAVQDKKLGKKAQTWLWSGKIYYSFATLSETPSSSEDKVRFHKVSTEAFKKARLLDKKKDITENIDKTLSMMNTVFLNEGLINYNSKDYSNAVSYFELCTNISTTLGKIDTLAIYNAALSYEKLNYLDKALQKYRICTDLNYGGPAIYDFMYMSLTVSGRNEEARVTLLEGLDKYPNDVSLLRTQMKEYVDLGESEKALDLIGAAIERKPKTAMLYLMRGVLKEKMNDEKASIVDDFQKAIDLREDYFDANRKMGEFYFDLGMKYINASCDIRDQSDAQATNALGKEELKKAIPYLEKAKELKSYDRKTQEALKKIYSHLDQIKTEHQIGAVIEN